MATTQSATFQNVPVRTETADRALKIMATDNLGYDSLVSLALDAYELVSSLTAHSDELARWRVSYHACLDGSSYSEVAA